MKRLLICLFLLATPTYATEVATGTRVKFGVDLHNDSVEAEMRIIEQPEPLQATRIECISVLINKIVGTFWDVPTTGQRFQWAPTLIPAQGGHHIRTGLPQTSQTHIHSQVLDDYVKVTQKASVGVLPDSVEVAWLANTGITFGDRFMWLEWYCLYRDENFDIITGDKLLDYFILVQNESLEYGPSWTFFLPPKPPEAKFVQVWLEETHWHYPYTEETFVKIGTYGMKTVALP